MMKLLENFFVNAWSKINKRWRIYGEKYYELYRKNKKYW